MHDLAFKLKPSKCYLVLLSSFLAISMVMVLCLPIAAWLKCLSLLLVIFYGKWMFWQFGILQSQQAIVSIRPLRDNKWQVQTRTNYYEAELSGDSTVTQLVSLLRFRAANAYTLTSCVIFYDSLEPDYYRQLLVVLRMG
jgi:hypothetical protein